MNENADSLISTLCKPIGNENNELSDSFQFDFKRYTINQDKNWRVNPIYTPSGAQNRSHLDVDLTQMNTDSIS